MKLLPWQLTNASPIPKAPAPATVKVRPLSMHPPVQHSRIKAHIMRYPYRSSPVRVTACSAIMPMPPRALPKI